MPFWPGDYLADTLHLSTAQHGAYLLLLMHYWVQGGLPDNDAELAAITRQPLKAWRQMRPIVQAFFHDGWHHKRVEADLAKVDQVTERRKVAGSIGGTRAAIARQRGKQLPPRNSSKATSNTSSKPGSKSAAGLQLEEEDITTTSSVAPRASETPNNSTTDQTKPGVASAALTDVLHAKGWVR
jgi:uncharacterized protein YdaU (DUF1376 family)